MRESGFYWVINDNEIGWEVAEFTKHNNWLLTGSELTYIDGELKEIDERKISRPTQRTQHIFPNPELVELREVGGR